MISTCIELLPLSSVNIEKEMFCLISRRLDNAPLIGVVVILGTKNEARFRSAVHSMRDIVGLDESVSCQRVQFRFWLCPDEIAKVVRYFGYQFVVLFE